MKILVGFSRPKKWKPFAWLIMKGYKTPYDHVYVRFHSDTYNRDIIYQASKTMVNFMGTKVFEAENLIIDEFPVEITPENYTALMQWAIDNSGTPYGIKQALGMAVVVICSWFGKSIKNPFSDGTQTFVCSELAAYVLKQYAGDIIPENMDDISPLDVYNYLLKLKTIQQ